MSGDTNFNINVGGGNIGGLQVGNNNTQTITQNIGDQTPTVEQVFKTIAESLPEEVAEEMQSAVIKPLEELAKLPAEEQASEEVKERAEPLYQRLVPYAPQIGNGLLAFGEAALSAFASSNPIVAGLLAVCKTVKATSASPLADSAGTQIA